MHRSQFLHKLEEEARFQAKLRAQPVLPENLKPLTDFITNHTWKVILVLSGLASLAAEWVVEGVR